MDLFKSLAEVERAHIEAALRQFRGNLTRTADALKIDRKTLYRKIARHRITTSFLSECRNVA